ncbi:flavin-containing monooxygenase [Brevibacillus centrosporus]|uniref:flavin-containing monooxygenase n=1 Tax=Brevibacillus centrosporus TaxID=54910 RepID=UPI0037F7CE82
MTDYDVIVIGAGQAGLSIGYYLQRHKLSFVILEKNDRVGTSWRERYDSLVLFTPRAFNDLPGLPFPGDRHGFPDKNEAAHYLEMYAHYHSFPIRLGVEVLRVENQGGSYQVHTQEQVFRARSVVVATGPFQEPYWPSLHAHAGKEIAQWHTATFRNGRQVDPGTVLVVGGGNSGIQIANELAQEHSVFLSIGQSRTHLPLSILGKTIFYYLRSLGVLTAPSSSWLGRLYRSLPDPIFGYKKELRQLQRAGKLKIAPRTVSLSGCTAAFEDGSTADFSTIIWATGYRPNYAWLDVPGACNELGRPFHQKGVSPVPGLFFLGLPWQRNRLSALMGGVGHDAAILTNEIVDFLRTETVSIGGTMYGTPPSRSLS